MAPAHNSQVSLRKEVFLRQTGNREQLQKLRKWSHMPRGSLFFERVIPILLVGMGILMVALVLFAAGVLLGIVRF
jgi:hypothetical protein